MTCYANADRPWLHYVVYQNPRDFPGKVVVRAVHQPTGRFLREPSYIGESLLEARATIPPGLTRIPRLPDDEPQIVEVWL